MEVSLVSKPAILSTWLIWKISVSQLFLPLNRKRKMGSRCQGPEMTSHFYHSKGIKQEWSQSIWLEVSKTAPRWTMYTSSHNRLRCLLGSILRLLELIQSPDLHLAQSLPPIPLSICSVVQVTTMSSLTIYGSSIQTLGNKFQREYLSRMILLSLAAQMECLSRRVVSRSLWSRTDTFLCSEVSMKLHMRWMILHLLI